MRMHLHVKLLNPTFYSSSNSFVSENILFFSFRFHKKKVKLSLLHILLVFYLIFLIVLTPKIFLFLYTVRVRFMMHVSLSFLIKIDIYFLQGPSHDNHLLITSLPYNWFSFSFDRDFKNRCINVWCVHFKNSFEKYVSKNLAS